MADHDPMCDGAIGDWRGTEPCHCDLIRAVREQIAAEIEAQPIDHRSPGRATISGLVTFARCEAYLRAARIARGGAQ